MGVIQSGNVQQLQCTAHVSLGTGDGAFILAHVQINMSVQYAFIIIQQLNV